MLLNKRELEVLNREYIHSGGFMDDFFGSDFNIKESTSDFIHKATSQNVTSQSIFSMIKDQATNLKEYSQSSSSLYSSVNDKLSSITQSSKPALTQISLITFEFYTYMLIFNLLLSEHDKNLQTQLLIFVWKSISQDFIVENSELIEILISTLEEFNTLYTRINEIQSSPYDLLEPFILKLWGKGVFSGKLMMKYFKI